MELKPLWLSFTQALESTFTYGHPDLINILNRVDKATSFKPIHQRVREGNVEGVSIVDYRPSLKQSFFDLAEPWLRDVLDGKLEEEDVFTLNHPDEAYIKNGGFLFFAMYKGRAVGCVVLKRLDEDSFEFAKLFIEPYHRSKGIATQLIERCITRCKENQAKELWLQTTMSMPKAHKLYYKLGFDDSPPPESMSVLIRTEKIMMKAL
ncbi:MAG: GNAT family N-acetyltransferase [Bacteroidota bacterium]